MFANKVVLITGGSAGIGAATAECFAKEGASLAIVGRNEVNLNDVAQRCEKLGAKVLIIKANVSKDEGVKTIVKQTVDNFGKLDVLVNNAGILKFASIQDSNMLEVFDEVMNTNLRSAIHITNLAVPYLKETKGNVVNVSSVAAMKTTGAGVGPYGISKAGMDHFTRSSALELAPSGVRVNSVNPGPVATEMIKTFVSHVPADNSNSPALGRMSEGSEIGDLILYLASDKARSITGSCYVIDNGTLL